MVAVALAYLPSVTSLLALLFAVICAPVDKLQDFWRSRRLTGVVKGVLLVVLFCASVAAAPSRPSQPADDIAVQQENVGQDAETVREEEPIQTVDPAPDEEDVPADEQPKPEPQPDPEPEPEPQPEPEPEPQPEPEPEQPAEVTTIRGRSSDTTVYVSSRSHTIHSVSDCSGMKNYSEMTLGEADGKGYDYCPNCW